MIIECYGSMHAVCLLEKLVVVLIPVLKNLKVSICTAYGILKSE